MQGETLTSFFEGINKLCGLKAECIVPYSFSLLVNTKFYERRKEYGFVIKRAPVLSGEVDLVISTNDVSYMEYQEGLYFNFALHLLYNARGLYYTANYLD